MAWPDCASATRCRIRAVADMLNRVRQPFNVNSIALAAARRRARRQRAPAALGRDQSRRHGAAARGLRCARRASPAVGRQFRADRLRPPGGAGLRSDAAAGRDRAARRQLPAAESPARSPSERSEQNRAYAGGAQSKRCVRSVTDVTLRRPAVRRRFGRDPRPRRQVDLASCAHARRHRRRHHRGARLSRKRRLSRDDARHARARRADRADRARRSARARRRSCAGSRRRRTRSTWAIPAPRCA